MTKSERSGQIKLKARTIRGEIVISETDKSTEITISSRESYTQQGQPHIANDVKANWDQVMESKKVTLCHLRALNHIIETGQDHPKSEKERLVKAIDEDKTVIPNLILMQKNQNPLDPKTGQPKTRPVCLTRTSYNQRANEYLCYLTGASKKG